MDERPFPHGPLPQPPPSRRGFLIVGGLAVVAAGGGAWWALSDDGTTSASVPTALIGQLHAARTAEDELIATIEAALKHPGSRGSVLRRLHADHVAHAAAIEALTADVLYPAKPSASSAPVTAPTGHISTTALRAAETRAARVAGKRAASLSGQAAVLLASIAACEATHAEVLR
jgi:hypothetical protein